MTTQRMENTGDAIGQSARLTREAHADLTSRLGVLDARLAGLGSQWQGQGAVAFVRVKAAWDEQVRRLLGALDGFAGQLDHTRAAFDHTDLEATDALTALGRRLG